MQESAPQPETTEHRAKRYHRTRRRLRWIGIALQAGLLLGLLFAGWSAGLRDLAWRWTDNVWLAVPAYAILLGALSKSLSLPIRFYSSYVLEHRYGLSNLTLGGWTKDAAKSTLLGAAFGLLALEMLYYALRRFPDSWWLLCWVFYGLFAILLASLSPVLLFPLFYRFRPIEDEVLKERLLQLCRRAGARAQDVMEWKLSAKSKKANAALVGLGKTRRILLADNLLSQYSGEEIEAILAHELAHHIYHHIGKAIGLQLGLSLAAFAVVDQALRQWGPHFDYEGLSDFANLPLLLAVGGAFSLLALPLGNAFSRRNERQADDFALQAIPEVGPFISSMNKLVKQNLAERRPHPVIEFLFHSHPSIEKRIRRAATFPKATQAM